MFNDEWMATFGFSTTEDCVGNVLDRRTSPELFYVNPGDTVRTAIEVMRSNGVSQLPVCKNEPPFAAARSAVPSTSWS